eukprot:4680719-Prymnesium_polylepis.1
MLRACAAGAHVVAFGRRHRGKCDESRRESRSESRRSAACARCAHANGLATFQESCRVAHAGTPKARLNGQAVRLGVRSRAFQIQLVL